MKQIANIKDIQNIIVTVSEKINNKHLQEFTYNYLNLEKIKYSKNDSISSNYLKHSNLYQIIISNKKYKYLLPEVLVAYYYDKRDINSFDLFVLEDFFVLYKNMNMYYFQKLDYEISDVELNEYILKKLNVNVENIIQINNKVLEEYKIEFNKSVKKEKLSNINIKRNHSFNIYLLSLSSLFMIIVYYIFNTSSSNPDFSIDRQNKVNKQNQLFIKEHLFHPLYNDFILITKEIKLYKLTLETFEFKKDRLHLIVNSPKKEDLYLFLELHKNKLITNKIEYIKDLNKYKVVIDVLLFK